MLLTSSGSWSLCTLVSLAGGSVVCARENCGGCIPNAGLSGGADLLRSQLATAAIDSHHHSSDDQENTLGIEQAPGG